MKFATTNINQFKNYNGKIDVPKFTKKNIQEIQDLAGVIWDKHLALENKHDREFDSVWQNQGNQSQNIFNLNSNEKNILEKAVYDYNLFKTQDKGVQPLKYVDDPTNIHGVMLRRNKAYL